MVYNENDENIDDISSLEDTELEPVKKKAAKPEDCLCNPA